MKNPTTLSKHIFLLAAVFVFGIGSALAQTTKPSDEYVSHGKFSFRVPKDSVANTVENDTGAVIYWGRPKDVVGDAAAFMITESARPDADKVFEMLSDYYYMEGFSAGVVRSVAGNHEFVVQEKKLVKIAGLNALKVVLTITGDKGKNRWAVYTLPCPEQKRMYVLNIVTTEANFDKWFAIAEPAVNSFKILK